MHKSLIKFFLGKKLGQSLFRFLFLFSLKGMNFGGGSDYQESGEAWVLKYIAKQTPVGSMVVFDVGGNVGNYAIQVAKILPLAKIYSFEPAKKTFESLQNNIQHYTNIAPYNLALGNQIGKAVLYSHVHESGLASVYDRVGLDLNNREAIQINTIDNFCEEHHLTQIDFLKLDIEGNEYQALEGASKMLKGNKIKFIQFEFGGTDIDARVFFRDFYNLLSPQYKIFRILKNGLYPILAYKETDEIFITTNYFAQLK
jgi:FkbM family methyltransferase